MLTFKRDDLVAALSKLRGLAGGGEWALAHFDVAGYSAGITVHDDGRHPTITLTRHVHISDNFSGSFSLKLAPLLTFSVAVMDSGEVSIRLGDDEHAYIKAGRNKLKLPLFKGPVPTVFEAQEEDRVAAISQMQLVALMSLSAVCDKPGSTSSIPLTEGVYFEVGKGYARALATDRYKAAYVWRQNVETFLNEKRSAVVNALAADLVVRNTDGEIDVYIDDVRIFFVGSGFSMYATLIPVDYPSEMLSNALKDDVGAGMTMDSGELVRKVTAICALSGSNNAPVHFSTNAATVEMRTLTELGAGEFYLNGTPMGDGGKMEFRVNGAYLKAAISLLETLGDDGMLEVSMFTGMTQPWVFFHSSAVEGARYAVARIAE